ncbi:MAG: histone deacetylase, partial [Thermoanaerobaculia bacterium]|nr:histone deacetylase [Thermoanaerobaculia bacterium]
WAAAGAGRLGFAAVRPPGHHAESSQAMGFCYLNNVAVAAEHLLAAHGLERVAIVDFDVHHGNGTQQIFYERAEVLFVSLHRYPFYPGTGAASERGRGAGEGATLNLPMSAGEGDAAYRRAFDESVLPALERFHPRLLLVSAGFDAWRDDPLGGMTVSREGYAEWGEMLGAAARRLCDGRAVSVLEGGYDLGALPGLVRGYLDGLARGAGPA